MFVTAEAASRVGDVMVGWWWWTDVLYKVGPEVELGPLYSCAGNDSSRSLGDVWGPFIVRGNIGGFGQNSQGTNMKFGLNFYELKKFILGEFYFVMN